MNALVHKQEYRTLWYKKYKYRIQLRNPTVGFICSIKRLHRTDGTYIQYKNTFTDFIKRKTSMSIDDLLSARRYNLLVSYLKLNESCFTKLEGHCYSLFTNDEAILKKFTSAFTSKQGKPNFIFTVTEAIFPDLTEGDTIYFKNDPPAMYRIFLKDFCQVEKSIGQLSSTIEKYSVKDKHLVPNRNLRSYLKSPEDHDWIGNLNVDVKNEEYLFLFLMMHKDIVNKYSKLKKIPE